MVRTNRHLQFRTNHKPRRRIEISLLMSIAFVLKILYKAFFSWWLNPALDHWSQKSFVNEIRRAFPFLFSKYQAKSVPNPRPGVQSPCISTTNVVFEFTRWRDENYAISVSPTFAPRDSCDLIDALRVVDPREEALPSPSANSWTVFVRVLEPRCPLLEVAFKQENFPSTKEKLAQLRRPKSKGVFSTPG